MAVNVDRNPARIVLPGVISALIAVVVMIFMLLVVEGGSIATAMRLGYSGPTLQATATGAGDLDPEEQVELQRKIADLADSRGMSVLASSSGGTGAFAVHDPDGRFHVAGLDELDAELGKDRTLISTALPDPSGESARTPVLSASQERRFLHETVFSTPLDHPIAGTFPAGALVGKTPVVALQGFEVPGPRDTWLFAGDGAPESAGAVGDVLRSAGLDDVETTVALPRSGSDFAGSTFGKFSVATMLLLLAVGGALSVTQLRRVDGRAGLIRFASVLAAGAGAGVLAVWLVYLVRLSATTLVGFGTVFTVGLLSLLLCAVIWAVIMGAVLIIPAKISLGDLGKGRAVVDRRRGLPGDLASVPGWAVLCVVGGLVLGMALTFATARSGGEMRELGVAANEPDGPVSVLRTSDVDPEFQARMEEISKAFEVRPDLLVLAGEMEENPGLTAQIPVADDRVLLIVGLPESIPATGQLRQGVAVVWGDAETVTDSAVTDGLTVIREGNDPAAVSMLDGTGAPNRPDNRPIVALTPRDFSVLAPDLLPGTRELAESVTCLCDPDELIGTAFALTGLVGDQESGDRVYPIARDGVYTDVQRSSATAALLTALLFAVALSVFYLLTLTAGARMWERRRADYAADRDAGVSGFVLHLRRQLFTAVLITVPVAVGFLVAYRQIAGGDPAPTLYGAQLAGAWIAVLVAHLLVGSPGFVRVRELLRTEDGDPDADRADRDRGTWSDDLRERFRAVLRGGSEPAGHSV
ncbi:hypothetical protein M0E84_05345 [Corynebacterium sp. CCM 9186]|uniref:hypothetical protein n=1 Tax=Corynebacterium meridianum TaxID=2765363 RepID=UPI0020042E88|nr:hypothetical protein [Corynebacterium meridianum]MCK7677462.1 hypothetical protein [Corynebacterium meridianum]